MRLTPKLLAGEDNHQGPVPGMERVKDLDLKSQTPGIMTLVRPVLGNMCPATILTKAR